MEALRYSATWLLLVASTGIALSVVFALASWTIRTCFGKDLNWDKRYPVALKFLIRTGLIGAVLQASSILLMGSYVRPILLFAGSAMVALMVAYAQLNKNLERVQSCKS